MCFLEDILVVISILQHGLWTISDYLNLVMCWWPLAWSSELAISFCIYVLSGAEYRLFLAHLTQRVMYELLLPLSLYCPSVVIFSNFYQFLWNHWSILNQTLPCLQECSFDGPLNELCQMILSKIAINENSVKE